MSSAYNPRYPYNDQGRSDLSSLFKPSRGSETLVSPSPTPDNPLSAAEFSTHLMTTETLMCALKTIQQDFEKGSLDNFDSRSLPSYIEGKSEIRPLTQGEIQSMELESRIKMAEAYQSAIEALGLHINRQSVGEAPNLYADYHIAINEMYDHFCVARHNLSSEATLPVQKAYARYQDAIIASCQSAIGMRERCLSVLLPSNPYEEEIAKRQRVQGKVDTAQLDDRISSNDALKAAIKQKEAKRRKIKNSKARKKETKREKEAASLAASAALAWNDDWTRPIRRDSTVSLTSLASGCSDNEYSDDEREGHPPERRHSLPEGDKYTSFY